MRSKVSYRSDVRMSSDLIEHVKLREKQRVLENLLIGSAVKKALEFQFSAYFKQLAFEIHQRYVNNSERRHFSDNFML